MLRRGPSQVTHIKQSLFSRPRQRTLVSTDSYTSCSSPLFLSTLLFTRFNLVVASLNTLLVYSTLSVLLHNCCQLLLKRLRIGDLLLP
ncbi:unnamed protein product [Hymenolepis diminuta]|uniref:Uncharacterized protein n=1 Tax=Hymenolepis diminuta TaxID=6216 RepID=A0A564XZE2_HYMDI|nr:unnamed protein product [Hymenolepis diminuta]